MYNKTKPNDTVLQYTLYHLSRPFVQAITL